MRDGHAPKGLAETLNSKPQGLGQTWNALRIDVHL